MKYSKLKMLVRSGKARWTVNPEDLKELKQGRQKFVIDQWEDTGHGLKLDSDGVPLVRPIAESASGQLICVPCPFCCQVHTHSKGEGDRVVTCGMGQFLDSTYRITYEGTRIQAECHTV